MKAISLWQPWASAIANGVKQIETRHWQTHYRGPIAIHAAQKKSRDLVEAFYSLMDLHPTFYTAFAKNIELEFATLPFGAVIATATLVECLPVDMITGLTEVERALGNYSSGRFGWVLKDVKRLAKPVPCRGRQRIFNVDL